MENNEKSIKIDLEFIPEKGEIIFHFKEKTSLTIIQHEFFNIIKRRNTGSVTITGIEFPVYFLKELEEIYKEELKPNYVLKYVKG